MPTARYGDAFHAFSAATDGAVHASKPYPVKMPARAACGAAAPPEAPTRSAATTIAAIDPRPLTRPASRRPVKKSRVATRNLVQRALQAGERLEQPVDLVARVVVRDAGAERLLRQSRRERDAVPVVGVPEAEAAFRKPGRRVDRRHTLDVEEERRHASAHRLRPVQRHARGEVLEQVGAELALVRADRGETADRVEV